MYVSFIAYPVKVLGPGRRIGIWTMGCNRNCYNCVSPFLKKVDKNKYMSVDKLLERIKKYLCSKKVDGITISGGEPFLQDDLLDLLIGLKKLNINDVLVYTGNTLEELHQQLDDIQLYLETIDVLVDGPYVDELNDNKNLRGSSNQKVYVFNENLKEIYEKYLNEERKFQKSTTLQGNFNLYIGIPLKR